MTFCVWLLAVFALFQREKLAKGNGPVRPDVKSRECIASVRQQTVPGARELKELGR